MVIMKKVILMVFLIFSLLMIVYGIGFILNYYLVIKYSIEIHALVNYAEIVVIYAIYALSLAVYWLLNINKK